MDWQDLVPASHEDARYPEEIPHNRSSATSSHHGYDHTSNASSMQSALSLGNMTTPASEAFQASSEGPELDQVDFDQFDFEHPNIEQSSDGLPVDGAQDDEWPASHMAFPQPNLVLPTAHNQQARLPQISGQQQQFQPQAGQMPFTNHNSQAQHTQIFGQQQQAYPQTGLLLPTNQYMQAQQPQNFAQQQQIQPPQAALPAIIPPPNALGVYNYSLIQGNIFPSSVEAQQFRSQSWQPTRGSQSLPLTVAQENDVRTSLRTAMFDFSANIDHVSTKSLADNLVLSKKLHPNHIEAAASKVSDELRMLYVIGCRRNTLSDPTVGKDAAATEAVRNMTVQQRLDGLVYLYQRSKTAVWAAVKSDAEISKHVLNPYGALEGIETSLVGYLKRKNLPIPFQKEGHNRLRGVQEQYAKELEEERARQVAVQQFMEQSGYHPMA